MLRAFRKNKLAVLVKLKLSILDEYYFYRGCSGEGLPTRKRLEEIGLGDVAEDLARMGKLADHESPSIAELLPTEAQTTQGAAEQRDMTKGFTFE